MIVNTTTDGEDYRVTVEDSNKVFNFEIEVINNKQGTFITYYNSNRDEYELLAVEPNGTITNEEPKLID